jgi:Flp pilus assembly protein TadD
MSEPRDPGLEEISENFLIFVHEEALGADPEDEEALAFLAQACTKRGRHEEGLALDRRLVALRPGDPVALYNLACSLSLTHRLDEAIETLRVAFDRGYEDLAHLERDPDLANVREHPGYASLIRRAEQA